MMSVIPCDVGILTLHLIHSFFPFQKYVDSGMNKQENPAFRIQRAPTIGEALVPVHTSNEDDGMDWGDGDVDDEDLRRAEQRAIEVSTYLHN